jgi:hypothetical protein
MEARSSSDIGTSHTAGKHPLAGTSGGRYDGADIGMRCRVNRRDAQESPGVSVGRCEVCQKGENRTMLDDAVRHVGRRRELNDESVPTDAMTSRGSTKGL